MLKAEDTKIKIYELKLYEYEKVILKESFDIETTSSFGAGMTGNNMKTGEYQNINIKIEINNQKLTVNFEKKDFQNKPIEFQKIYKIKNNLNIQISEQYKISIIEETDNRTNESN